MARVPRDESLFECGGLALRRRLERIDVAGMGHNLLGPYGKVG
jgi:hypothetical protein